MLNYYPYVNNPNFYDYNNNISYKKAKPLRPRRFSEDFMERNEGKIITAYMTYDGSNQWRDVVYTGQLLEQGRDFFVIRLTEGEHKGKEILLLNINVSYIIFEEPASFIRMQDGFSMSEDN